MHKTLLKFVGNTFLTLVLIGLIVLPISTVTVTHLADDPNVLSSSDDRTGVQTPQGKTIKANGEKLQEEMKAQEHMNTPTTVISPPNASENELAPETTPLPDYSNLPTELIEILEEDLETTETAGD